MFVSIAHAAEGAGVGQPSPFGAFVPLIIIFAIFYFLLIRPQQQKAKQHDESLNTMKAGDEVLTAGGIYGKISKIDGDVVMVEIADKVKVKTAKSQLYPQAKNK